MTHGMYAVEQLADRQPTSTELKDGYSFINTVLDSRERMGKLPVTNPNDPDGTGEEYSFTDGLLVRPLSRVVRKLVVGPRSLPALHWGRVEARELSDRPFVVASVRISPEQPAGAGSLLVTATSPVLEIGGKHPAYRMYSYKVNLGRHTVAVLHGRTEGE